MIIIFLLIWLILSIYAIYITDHKYYWNNLFKIFIGATLLALMYNAWKVYDPNQNHMIATIELNPTWELALIIALLEGTCITGPIAGIHSFIEYRRRKRRG